LNANCFVAARTLFCGANKVDHIALRSLKHSRNTKHAPPKPKKTVLMYLSTPEEGGETVFPDAEFKSTAPDISDCGRRGLANKPYKGDALMFYSLTPDGTEDPKSLHGSCPTTKGCACVCVWGGVLSPCVSACALFVRFVVRLCASRAFCVQPIAVGLTLTPPSSSAENTTHDQSKHHKKGEVVGHEVDPRSAVRRHVGGAKGQVVRAFWRCLFPLGGGFEAGSKGFYIPSPQTQTQTTQIKTPLPNTHTEKNTTQKTTGATASTPTTCARAGPSAASARPTPAT
jgi:hypothetical protein